MTARAGGEARDPAARRPPLAGAAARCNAVRAALAYASMKPSSSLEPDGVCDPSPDAAVIVPRGQIERRLTELAEQIRRTCPAGELTVLGVMNGALFFLADLVRRMPMRVRIATVRVSSYRGTDTRAGAVRLADGLFEDLAGRDVLIVDDILDTGATLSAVAEAVASHGPRSCRICVLLRKPDRGRPRTEADFVGFDIPDTFVVGYGLDFDGRMRNLPDIVALREDRPADEPVR